jgi:hypothetical protein
MATTPDDDHIIFGLGFMIAPMGRPTFVTGQSFFQNT